MFEFLIDFVQEQYRTKEFVPLHAPIFVGNERSYLADTIDSTFVSSVGAYVNRFETDIASYTCSPAAVATVNGTCALHIALKLAGVGINDLVITQSLTFVATCNAIAYCGAEPIFIDVDRDTLGLSASCLEAWLEENAVVDDELCCRHKKDGRSIRCCLPMHTFGHPVDIDGLLAVCSRWHLPMVEDAAESLGSFYKDRHTGTYGLVGILSFNGNKIITTGGGGMLLTSESLAAKAKHLTTTAKQPHPYEFVHDELGYNYRMPNLNAALGCAQLEQLEKYLTAKRQLASDYQTLLSGSEIAFVAEPRHCRSNYWLNTVICKDREQRDLLLKETNAAGVMTRPVWRPMHCLPMYEHCIKGPLNTTEWLVSRVVNVPSSVIVQDQPA